MHGLTKGRTLNLCGALFLHLVVSFNKEVEVRTGGCGDSSVYDKPSVGGAACEAVVKLSRIFDCLHPGTAYRERRRDGVKQIVRSPPRGGAMKS